MKTESKSKKEIASDVIQDIRESVNEFLDEFATNTKDTNNFLTIDQLETMFSKLDSKTRKIYLDMISDSLSNINEKDIIKLKKDN